MNKTPDRPGPPPVFHEKRTYRRRRLMDAARFAPVLAMFLWLVPLFWSQTGESRISSATALIYIFALWAGVIVVTLALSYALGQIADDDAGTDP